MSEGLSKADAPTFKVMIETRSRIGGPGGWLHVYQGELVCVPTRSTRRLFRFDELRFRGSSVTWIRRALFPPWVNMAIDFTPDGRNEPVRLALGFAARRHLRQSLLAAGFKVEDKTSWSLLFGP